MSRELGQKGEALAAKYLKENGLQILAQNYSSRFGEIDLVAREGETIVFVEVKYRKDEGFGQSIDYVTKKKITKILKAARHYLYTNELLDVSWRLDAVAIDGFSEEIEWLQNIYIEGLDNRP